MAIFRLRILYHIRIIQLLDFSEPIYAELHTRGWKDINGYPFLCVTIGDGTYMKSSVDYSLLLDRKNYTPTPKILCFETMGVQGMKNAQITSGINTLFLFQAGGTGLVAGPLTPVSGTISLFVKAPLTALTLHGANSAVSRAVVVTEAATNARVGCGTLVAV